MSICALSTAGNIGDILAPLQIGVGISGGAEIPGHALRLDILDPEVVTVQVDLQNAFNLSDRTAIAHAPGPVAVRYEVVPTSLSSCPPGGRNS